MLVDHADAGADSIGRRVEHLRLAVDQNLAFIRLIQAVQLPHQRAFAGAILAQQGVHLAGIHVQADLVVRQNARKTLDDVAHFNAADILLHSGLSRR